MQHVVRLALFISLLLPCIQTFSQWSQIAGNATTEITNTFRRLCGYFRVRDYHAFKLRQYLGGTPKMTNDIPFSIAVESAGKYNIPFLSLNNKYEIIMKLPKNCYRCYEPVVAEFIVINHDAKPFDMYGLFDENTKEPRLAITDGSGNVRHYNMSRFFNEYWYSAPSYTLNPNESLYVSMPINNWGIPGRFQSFDNNDFVLGQQAYFPPGHYKAVYFFDHRVTDGAKIESNQVEFDVTENDAEDNIILKRMREHGYDIPEYIKICEQIRMEFPDNPLIEAIYAEELKSKHLGIMNNPYYDAGEVLESDYERFISLYPGSSYLINDKFFMLYILKKFQTNNKDLGSTVLQLHIELSNDLIDKFLKNDRRLENIIEGHK